MKTFLFLSAIATMVISASDCSSKKDKDAKKYKGRLEIKGICMNYTIKLVEGTIDTSRIAASWKDDHSGKTHANVFALGNPCSFPNTINEGDEFFFAIDTAAQTDCMVCQAYYPTPPRSLTIKVLDK